MRRAAFGPIVTWLAGFALLVPTSGRPVASAGNDVARINPVLEWNQAFIDTLIATNTANSSSPRLGAIVHTAVFDALNGIEGRYTSVFMHSRAPHGTSRRAAVVSAAYTTLVGLFPSQQSALDARYAASLAALTERCQNGGQPQRPHRGCEARLARGLDWGAEVAHAVLAWRANDGFNGSYPAFTGGTAIGQWRPTPPAFGPMSAQALAFTEMFVLAHHAQFDPGPPRILASTTYADDFKAVKALGRRTGSTRTDEQTALAPFWEGNASVHWNQAANQIAQRHAFSMSRSTRLLAVLNIAMADTAFTTFTAKRFYGAIATEVTWRPVTAIALAEADGNPDTAPAPDGEWLPLINTPSHPEYPAGHPSLNGAAATVLLSHVGDTQTFTLTTTGQPSRTYYSITRARADGNNARIWGGMHYPSTVTISDALGAAIARYVDFHAMQPLDWNTR